MQKKPKNSRFTAFLKIKENFFKKSFTNSYHYGILSSVNANVAHPVERHLAKVEVASSSLVIRSRIDGASRCAVFLF